MVISTVLSIQADRASASPFFMYLAMGTNTSLPSFWATHSSLRVKKATADINMDMIRLNIYGTASKSVSCSGLATLQDLQIYVFLLNGHEKSRQKCRLNQISKERYYSSSSTAALPILSRVTSNSSGMLGSMAWLPALPYARSEGM